MEVDTKTYIATKVRIYPTKQQKVMLNQALGSCRFLYNYYLAKKNEVYRQTGANFNFYACCKDLTGLKKQEDYKWLAEVNAQSLQQTLRNLETAFLNFFRGRTKFPSFKKKSGHDSFHVPQHFTVNQEQSFIKIPKIGVLQFRGGDFRYIVDYRSISISRTPDGRYYASILTEKSVPKLQQVTKQIGIDVGIKTFASVSDGTKFDKPIRKYTKKVKYNQRQLAKKKRGSKSRERQRLKLARYHAKQTNELRDFHHKLSKKLVDENQVIAVEDLAVKNMMKNRKLSRAISECGWGQFLQFLDYKCKLYGRDFVKIGRFHPSSKTCSCCGSIKEVLSLKDRQWTCADCGAVHDRDKNASTNILMQGLNILSGLGAKSDIKQKRGEALEMLDEISRQDKSESLTHEAVDALASW